MSLFTVRHVFVEFVEGMKSGIRNPECGIRNTFPFVIISVIFGLSEKRTILAL